VDATGRAEQRPEVGAEAYRLLFEHAREMACTLDLNGRFTAVNRAGERLTGFSEKELLGRFALELIAPELQEQAAWQFQKRLRSNGDRKPDPTVLVTRDGRRVPIEVTSTLIRRGGDVVGVLGLIADVSERRRSEAALLESEQRFRGSFEAAAIGMALVAPGGRFLEVNGSLCELLGYREEELLERSDQEITHPDDLDLDVELVRRVLASETPSYQLEKRYVHRDGRVVWVLLSVSLVSAADGEPRYFVAHVEDVSERKHAIGELERREAQLAEAQQLAHIGSWEFDYATRTVTMSRELKRVYGFEPDAVPSPALLQERIHPDDLEAVVAAADRDLPADESSHLEFRIVLPDGRVRWLYTRAEPVLDGGIAIGRRGVAEDITERKEAERQLAEAERRYRALVEQLPLGFYIRPLDMSRPNMYASPQVEPMLGYPPEEWGTNPNLFETIVHPEDRARAVASAKRVRETGKPSHDEYRYIARDGRVVWVQDETHRVVDEDGEAFVQGFLLDISERKQAEAERDRLRHELDHAQKLEAIGRLAGGVAHDFNNMLTAIKGYSELLLATLEPGTESHGHAGRIKDAADQAAALPEQLLAFGRKQTLEPTLVDLGELVTRTSDLLRHVITEAIEITSAAPPTPATASVDPGRFEQVLVNLALNARDAMPTGGTLAISTSVELVDEREAHEHDASPGPYVVVSVTDTGQGMDAETRARAFEPFFTTKPLGKGSGLGLASVYGTVSQSGGFVRLESQVGVGTTVRIYLPAVQAGADLDGGPSLAEPRRSPVALLVEDEPLVRELVDGVLSQAGFDVQTARNGADALAGLENGHDPIALLVTDLVMPKLGGQELAERVRARHPDLPVVFMSGYTETPPRLDLARSGPTVFLKKPFSTAAFAEAIESVRAPEAASASVPALTRRERQVLRHLSHGMTNEKVAAELGISAETVQSHVRNAMGKLDADTRTEAVATAIRHSLLE